MITAGWEEPPRTNRSRVKRQSWHQGSRDRFDGCTFATFRVSALSQRSDGSICDAERASGGMRVCSRPRFASICCCKFAAGPRFAG